MFSKSCFIFSHRNDDFCPDRVWARQKEWECVCQMVLSRVQNTLSLPLSHAHTHTLWCASKWRRCLHDDQMREMMINLAAPSVSSSSLCVSFRLRLHPISCNLSQCCIFSVRLSGRDWRAWKPLMERGDFKIISILIICIKMLTIKMISIIRWK